MLTITNILIKENHVAAEFDTGEKIRLPLEAYSLYHLSKGKALDSTEYGQLKEESARFECKQKSLDYLSIRSRSVFELKTYLFKKGFDKDIIDATVTGLKERGFLDDLEFSKQYLGNKQKRKTVGKNLLKHELYKKGISKDVIREAIDESHTADEDEIYDLAQKKLKQLGKKANASKLIFFLQQRGFSYKEISPVIARLKNESEIMHDIEIEN